MRVATGIVALFAAVGAGIHSIVALIGGAILGSSDRSAVIAALILLMSMLFLFGGAFSFKKPKLSYDLFSAALTLSVIFTIGVYFYMIIWAVASLVLFIMAYNTNKMVSNEVSENSAT